MIVIFTFVLQPGQTPLSTPYCDDSPHLLLRLLGFLPPEFCLLRFNHSADLRPLDHFVAPILTLSLLPLPCLVPQSLLKFLSSGPSAFSSTTSFANPFFSFQPFQLMFFALKLLTTPALCIQVLDRQLCLPAPPAFGGFCCPYFGQERPNCAVFDFKLKVP